MSDTEFFETDWHSSDELGPSVKSMTVEWIVVGHGPKSEILELGNVIHLAKIEPYSEDMRGAMEYEAEDYVS